MALAIGERVGGPGRDAYVIGECISSNALTALHAARKVFYNYRYDERAFYEAAEDEWMEVRIRSLSTSCSNNAAAVARGREMLRYEAETVLGRFHGWFPEPLDWLECRGQPLLVMSVPRGQPLCEGHRTTTGASPMVPQIMSELLTLLEALHGSGQIVGGFGPDDFLVDETGRICCTATDRVFSAEMAAVLPRVLFPSHDPHAFAANEALGEPGKIDRRSDLFSWSALFVYLITGEQQRKFSAETLLKFTAALEETAKRSPDALRAMSPNDDRRPMEEIVCGWTAAVQRALSADPRNRPSTVRALRRIAGPGRPLELFLRFFRRRRRSAQPNDRH